MGILDRAKKVFGVGQLPQTTDYTPMAFTSAFLNYAERPLFTLWTVDLMMYDPQVCFGLALGDAPLALAEVEVEGDNDAVNEFVQAQFEKVWGRSAAQIIETKRYGYAGFEVFYEVVRGRLEYFGIRDVHPRDARPLTHRGRLAGVRVRRIRRNQGRTDLLGPKGLWLTYDARHGQPFGVSLLERAYPPWYEKNMEQGGLDLRRLRMLKDAWIGDVVTYPLGVVFRLPDGREVTGKELMVEIQEMRTSGGSIALPSDVHPGSGVPKFSYTPPQHVAGSTEILNYVDNVDREIWKGLHIPPEIVEAAATGSGFSGRSIPWMAYVMVRQKEFDCYLRAIDRQIIRPMVDLNFGHGVRYELKPTSLLESLKETTSEGEGGGNPFGGEVPMQFAERQPDSAATKANAITKKATLAGAGVGLDLRQSILDRLKKNGMNGSG